MITSKNGQEEAAAKNNHSVAYWLQVGTFARFTGDENLLATCRRQFKEVIVPNQMAADGSFPLELKRTKPYAYSIFQLDNLATLCQVLSTPTDDLWTFELSDGRGIRKAVAYLYLIWLTNRNGPSNRMSWHGKVGLRGNPTCFLRASLMTRRNTLNFGENYLQTRPTPKSDATSPSPNRYCGSPNINRWARQSSDSKRGRQVWTNERCARGAIALGSLSWAQCCLRLG